MYYSTEIRYSNAPHGVGDTTSPLWHFLPLD
jgi:hypothetical protein